MAVARLKGAQRRRALAVKRQIETALAGAEAALRRLEAKGQTAAIEQPLAAMLVEYALRYNPGQPRDSAGRWTSGGGGGGISGAVDGGRVAPPATGGGGGSSGGGGGGSGSGISGAIDGGHVAASTGGAAERPNPGLWQRLAERIREDMGAVWQEVGIDLGSGQQGAFWQEMGRQFREDMGGIWDELNVGLGTSRTGGMWEGLTQGLREDLRDIWREIGISGE